MKTQIQCRDRFMSECINEKPKYSDSEIALSLDGKEIIKINGQEYVDYTESDLRFTGWEHECVIIDRCENHYLVPLNRYMELKRPKPTQKIAVNESNGAFGCKGDSGIVGSS
jgi:hypothetical protein